MRPRTNEEFDEHVDGIVDRTRRERTPLAEQDRREGDDVAALNAAAKVQIIQLAKSGGIQIRIAEELIGEKIQ